MATDIAGQGNTQEFTPFKNGLAVGVFNGLNVAIFDSYSMNLIYKEGSFGKGSLSKGAPNYNKKLDDVPQIMLEQQFQNEAKWKLKTQHFLEQDKQRIHDFHLSYISISNFLQSNVADNPSYLWKLWKKNILNCVPENSSKNNNINTEYSSEHKINKNCMKFFEFTDDKTMEIDKYLSEIVNIIIETNKPKMNPTVQKSFEKVIVINSELESFEKSIESVSARLEKRPFPITESLKLNLEESLYLNFTLKYLKIIDSNNIELTASELWEKFNNLEKNFFEKYFVYHYYRKKGWIVQSGLKYGGNYLLYKDGPDYNHASYLIKIIGRNENLEWKEFLAVNRLVETIKKDVVFCTVFIESESRNGIPVFPDCLESYRVQEILSKRWFPTKERISDDKT